MKRVNYNCKCTDSGIYRIVCTASNKVYVGSSYRLGFRVSQHATALLKNQHSNPHLQLAYNKYGVDSFYFEVLELCPIASIIEREQYYISFYNSSDREVGYNIRSVADSCLGIKRTPEQLVKHSEVIKKAWADGKMPANPNWRKSTWRSVDEYYKGVKINTYESAVLAAKAHHIDYKAVNNSCRGLTKNMRLLPNYTFKYTDGGVAKTPNRK